MNHVILTGRLTADPELKTTNSGKTVADFTIAVERYVNGEKQAEFIRCAAWNKTGENLCRYKRKGEQIGVSGILRVQKYTGQDGRDRYKTFVQCQTVEYLGGRDAGQAPAQQAPQTYAPPQAQQAYAPPQAAQPGFEDDLPF